MFFGYPPQTSLPLPHVHLAIRIPHLLAQNGLEHHSWASHISYSWSLYHPLFTVALFPLGLRSSPHIAPNRPGTPNDTRSWDIIL
jgi:hypothetical protein